MKRRSVRSARRLVEAGWSEPCATPIGWHDVVVGGGVGVDVDIVRNATPHEELPALELRQTIEEAGDLVPGIYERHLDGNHLAVRVGTLRRTQRPSGSELRRGPSGCIPERHDGFKVRPLVPDTDFEMIWFSVARLMLAVVPEVAEEIQYASPRGPAGEAPVTPSKQIRSPDAPLGTIPESVACERRC